MHTLAHTKQFPSSLLGKHIGRLDGLPHGSRVGWTPARNNERRNERTSCLVHTVNHFVNEGWYSCDYMIILMWFQHFMCLSAKQHTWLKWKRQPMGWLFHQVVPKHWLGDARK